MGIKIKKIERETSQSLSRRFTRAIQQSGVLLEARSNRFFHRPKSKTARKKAALRKQALRKEYARLKKLGKLENKRKK